MAAALALPLTPLPAAAQRTHIRISCSLLYPVYEPSIQGTRKPLISGKTVAEGAREHRYHRCIVDKQADMLTLQPLQKPRFSMHR